MGVPEGLVQLEESGRLLLKVLMKLRAEPKDVGDSVWPGGGTGVSKAEGTLYAETWR